MTTNVDGAPKLNEFSKRLTEEDELGSVIRAHLHIEFHIDELIAATAPNPDAVQRLNLDYSGKIGLLSILGYNEKLTKPLQNIGDLRNKFAHRLDFKITKDRMRSLYETLDTQGQQIVHHAYDNTRKNSLTSARHPKKMWSLVPKDIFSLLASAIRVMVLIAHKEQTGSYPAGSVPDRYISGTKDETSAPNTYRN